MWARMMSCVPSVEPVSTTTQWVMIGRTLSRQRRITDASFLTIMQREIVGAETIIEWSPLCLEPKPGLSAFSFITKLGVCG